MPQTVLLYDCLRHVVDYVLMDIFDMYVSSRATRRWRKVMIRRDPRTWKLASEVTVRDFVGCRNTDI